MTFATMSGVSSRARRRCAAVCVVVAATACVVSCSQGVSRQEYDAAMSSFDELADEAKAYACADDYYAVMFGVEGFVLVERCDEGRSGSVDESRPLSEDFERQELAYTRAVYAENPPDSGLLRGVDPAVLCDQDEDDVRDGIAQWREQSEFPSWDGVEYVPSVDHETAKLVIWRAVACPLVER